MQDAEILAGKDGAARPDRPALLCFVADGTSEAMLRDGLAEILPPAMDWRRGGIRAAIAQLSRAATPRTLIVDVGGEAQPLTALGDLSEVLEPDVRVLAIGDVDDVNFYRQVTRGLGVLEYLAKPLSRDMVARHFAPLLSRAPVPAEPVLGGRVVAITGARGGVGATTLAVNLAWHFGVAARRHTVLLDPDLYRGSAALMLDVSPGPGLRTALETPARIDALFVERAAQPVTERLHVLAAEENLAEHAACADGAAEKLIAALRRRYNFIVVDLGFAPLKLSRDLAGLAHRRVIVLDPSLAAARDARRMLAVPRGPDEPRRPVVVLNRAGRPGGLKHAQVEDALGMRPDVVIPDLPRKIGTAATMAEPAAKSRGTFRASIVALAREVAFVRLLDSAAGSRDAALGEARRRRWTARFLGRFR